MHPKISIITPSFNKASFIEHAINSVLLQGYKNFEHVIVDGGSTDGTVEMLKHYPHLVWISEPDDGQSDAMNKGFKLSLGEIIVYLNADDFFEKNAFAAVVEAFEEGAQFVVGKVRVLKDDGGFFINDPKLTFGEMLRWWEPNAYSYNPTGYFYLREVQDAIGGFNVENHLAMDLEFLLEAALRYQLVKVDKILGNFRFIRGTKSFEHHSNEFEIMRFTRKYLSNLDDIYRLSYEKDIGVYEKTLKTGKESSQVGIYQLFVKRVKRLLAL